MVIFQFWKILPKQSALKHSRRRSLFPLVQVDQLDHGLQNVSMQKVGFAQDKIWDSSDCNLQSSLRSIPSL